MARASAEDLIAMGKWNFIFWRGLVGWGLPTAILFHLIMWAMGSDSDTNTLYGVIRSLVIFPGLGIFWGAFMWLFVSYAYNKSDSKKNNKELDV